MTDPTRLAALVDAQVKASTEAVILRTVDRMAEQMAADLMKDTAYRDEMVALAREAFRRAIASLQEFP